MGVAIEKTENERVLIPKLQIVNSNADSTIYEYNTNTPTQYQYQYEELDPDPNNMTNFSSIAQDYDEDLSYNPFFQSFLQSYVDLFSQCVQDRWIICVPRKDSLPKYSFTLEDFTSHILKPWNVCLELKDRNAGTSASSSRKISGDNCSSTNGTSNFGIANTNASADPVHNWNFRTLTDLNVQLIGATLYVETSSKFVHQIQVLFEETFYTPDKKCKYKILCVSSPLNASSQNSSALILDQFANIEEEPLDPALWSLNSLRDCIDFLWSHGRRKTLETYDSYIRLFLHNHRTLEDLPLPVIRDLVLDLYRKCLGFVKREEKKKQRKKRKQLHRGDSSQSSISSCSSAGSGSSGESSTNSPAFSASSSAAQLNFQIATETYVIHGIHRQLMASLTSAASWEDSTLNKLLRNLAEIHPEDLEISLVHWDNLSRAKNELGKLPLATSPLAKLGCLMKTMKHCQRGSSDGAIAFGADELIPIWVYLIIKASISIDNWTAQLQLLKQFRFSMESTGGISGDNEAAYLITTLEASLLFLNSGKIHALGLDSERDTGTPCDDYVAEFWLRCLFSCGDSEAENSEDVGIGEMYQAIRLGNLQKLEQLIKVYEDSRINQLLTPKNKNQLPQSLEAKLLCHPLCNCTSCSQLVRVKQEQKQKKLAPPDPILQLRNKEAGLSLLHVACIYGRPKIVDYLLAQGAGVDVPDNHGLLPIHHAAGRGHQNALLLLLHSGSPLDQPDNSLNTPLHLAALNGHESCVKALIYYAEHSKTPLNPSSQNCHGDTPLHSAAKFGFIGIVQLLVESGASISITNNRQKNPIDIAHDVHIVRTLQRSLKRRSLIHNSHGDFVNVDVVRKGEHETGVVMLISEPVMQNGADADAASPETSESLQANEAASIPASTAPVPAPATLPRVRKFSTVITPSFASTTNPDSSEFKSKPNKSRQKRSYTLNNNNNNNNYEGVGSSSDFDDSGEMKFQIENYVPKLPVSETEHFRRISVDSLDLSPFILAQMAQLGVKQKESIVEREISKLFKAIEIGDLPLALFYLGIPVEELENFTDTETESGELNVNVKAEAEKYVETVLNSPCHPLCPCQKCLAKSQGILSKFNLDLNSVRNASGLNPLHIAAQKNMKNLVIILLKYGSDLSLRSSSGSGSNPNGKTALEYAKENYHEEIAQILQSWKEAIQNYGKNR